MKRCPYCDEEIQDKATKCKHCGSMLGTGGSDTLDQRATLEGGLSAPQYDTLDAAVTQGQGATILGGQYRIVRKLGEGGMGVVYLAEDREMGNRPVAVKVLPPLLARNLRAVENLRKEAMVAIGLTHPNIIRLYGFHTDGDLKFLVMEYIDGQTLEERILHSEHGRLSIEEVLPIAEQVAAALDYAHSRKPPVFHRDLKPSNVMIDKEGQVKLLDFGIAREMKDSFTRVTGQETSGTIPYMSPEQLNGDTPTAAMDIYSFGVTLYECLSGHTPFHTGDIKHQILTKQPLAIEDLPEHVNKALQGALAKEPSARPAKAADLVARLKNAAPVDRESREIPVPQRAADVDAATLRIRKWIENREADWKDDEWKDFVISLYDDGCAVGLSHKKLEMVRDQERKAWIKAEENRKAEKARLAEERRRAAEEAERKQREAEAARRRREEEQLYEEIKSSPTIALCERYLLTYSSGRYDRQTEQVLRRLRSEGKSGTRVGKTVLVLAAIGVTVLLMGRSILRLAEGNRSVAPQAGGETRNSSEPSGISPTAGQVITNSIGMKMVWISPGEFLMGSLDNERDRDDDEGPQHRVKLTKGFYLGVYEVTQRQWQAVMGSNPSHFKGEDLPVERVSWEEAMEFCRKLSAKEGVEYRLPTEAEWEYACRAGSTTQYGFGGSDPGLGEYAWYSGNSDDHGTHPVGQKKPNGWGLYDMHGSVWEWCQDWDGAYSGGPATDPLGPASGVYRVYRGGAWCISAGYCRSAARSRITPFTSGNYLGIRLARTTWSNP